MQSVPQRHIAPSPGGTRRWRDLVAGGILFAATAAVIFWQNAHLAVLWDLSYVLDTATRIAQGQMPYRDFPLAHAPLTFLVQAAIIRLTGRVFFHHLIYAAAAGGLGTVLAWRIVWHTLRGRVGQDWAISVLLAAPLAVVGVYCIFPHPSYDCDCAIAVLAAILLLQKLSSARKASALRCFAAGAAAAVPLFFKQNIGLPLLAITVATVLSTVGAKLVSRLRDFKNDGDWNGSHDRRTRPPTRQLAGRAERTPTRELVQKEPACHEERTEIRTSFSAEKANQESGPKSEPHTAGDPGIVGLLAILAGIGAALVAAGITLHCTAGLGNYLHWTIAFAAQRRMPGIAAMLGVYREPMLLWMLPCMAAGTVLLKARRTERPVAKATHVWGHIFRGLKAPAPSDGGHWREWLGLVLVCAPFLWTLFSLYLYEDADERGDSLLVLWPLLLILVTALALWSLRKGITLRALVPGTVLVTINGTLMSQQLWGSTYAIWPLLVILIAEGIAFLGHARDEGDKKRTGKLALAAAAVISVTLLVCGGAYTASEERLSYAQRPDGPLLHSSVHELAGLSATGRCLPEFEELLAYANANIPSNDGLILIPGEDPFYFATGRTPQFPVLLFDPATQPYSPDELRTLARQHAIRWLIVKRDLQINEDPTPQKKATLNAFMQDFTLVKQLAGYDVYRRRLSD